MRLSTMRVRMRLFGQLKEHAEDPDGWREVREGTTVEELVSSLRNEGALPEALLCASAIAVNQKYVKGTCVLADGDEVAVLPPVSGGAA